MGDVSAFSMHYFRVKPGSDLVTLVLPCHSQVWVAPPCERKWMRGIPNGTENEFAHSPIFTIGPI